MTALPDGPLVAWYGDDFTGSAATMEVLAFAGVPSVLFLDIPTEAQRARFPLARAIGIASTARSHSPDWMERHLPPAFRWLAGLGAPVVHYKVCSTLDSAPHVGSIGRAIDIGLREIGSDWVPCLLAAPPLRRYQAFGQLYAAAGDAVYRLDRHPVMARHPVTPMDEADVARHLSRQTDQPFGLVDAEALEGDAAAALARARAQGARVICLDTMRAAHMQTCGALIWEHRDGPRFAVGSQGIEYALVAHWRNTGALPVTDLSAGAGPVARLLAVSGSVSPTTAAQIAWAEANGFAVIALDAAAVACGDGAAEARAVEAAKAALGAGRDPLICTARGPDDPAVASMRGAVADKGIAPETANTAIGAALGRVLRQLLRETGLRRAVISGGDTSGHAARQLGLYAFTALAPTIPGAALLRAHSEDSNFDGLELALKGGQMGSPDYFGWIKRGGGAA
ncbi:MAG: four-carbon acid sugar kinase family protein [Roseivivax sp.]|nr:four-carbon acid sugar kinase family protein [Roseivivax sp.]